MQVLKLVMCLCIATLMNSVSAEKDNNIDKIKQLLKKYKGALGVSLNNAGTDGSSKRGSVEAEWDKDDKINLQRDASILHGRYTTVKMVEPGKPPRKIVEKRHDAVGCSKSEWLVFVDSGQTSACVPPRWESAYDPTYCTRMINNFVYCDCDGFKNIPGIKEGIDTCIDKAQALQKGRCSLKPCTKTYRCVESQPGMRYDCVEGDVSVPIWYGAHP